MAVVGVLTVVMGVNNAPLTAGLASAQGQLKGFSGVAGAATAAVRTAAVGIGLGAVAGAALGINAAADFEDAFAGVRKTVSETDLAAAGLTFDDLAQQFRQMATEIPVGVEELAAIGETAGALGIKAGDIEEFTRTVALLGSTTNLSTDEAASALGKVGTILGLSGSEFEDFADILVLLGNTGASTESEIIEITKRFASAGQAVGLTTPQILAFSSAIASAGVEPEAAGSSLSRLFTGMVKGAATGSKAGREFAKLTGKSFTDFSSLVETDTVGAMQLVLESLQGLDKFGQIRALEAIGITNVRDQDAIRKLAQTYETNLLPALENAGEAQGALATEAEKRFDTFNSRLTLLGNNFNELLITIGTPLLPIAAGFVASITGAVQAVSGWIASGAQISSTFQPIIDTVVGRFRELWATAQTVGGVLMDLATRVWEGGLNRVIGTAATVIGSVIDVFSGLVTMIVTNEDAMNGLRTAADLIGRGFGIVSDAVRNTLTFLGDLGDAIRNDENAMNTLRGIADFLASGFGSARDAISGVVTFLGDLAEAILTNEDVLNTLRTVADLIGTGFGIVADAVKNIPTFLGELGDAIRENEDLLNILTGVADLIGSGFVIARDAVSGLVGWLGDLVGVVANNQDAMNFLRGFAEAVGTGFGIAAGAVGTLITKLQELVDFVVKNMDTLKAIGSWILPGGQGGAKLGTEIGTNIFGTGGPSGRTGGTLGKGAGILPMLPPGGPQPFGPVGRTIPPPINRPINLTNTSNIYIDGEKVGTATERRLFNNASQYNSGFTGGELR